LAEFRIGHIAELGGLRGKGKAIDSDINGFWKNRSFHTYADYAMPPHRRSGPQTLFMSAAGSAINRGLTLRMVQSAQYYFPQLLERIQKGDIHPSL
jgi:hypothetical protein